MKSQEYHMRDVDAEEMSKRLDAANFCGSRGGKRVPLPLWPSY